MDIIETDLVTRSVGLYPSLTGHYTNRPCDQEWRSVSFTDWTLYKQTWWPGVEVCILHWLDIIETDLMTRSGGLYPSLTGHYRNRPCDQEWRSVSFTDWTLYKQTLWPGVEVCILHWLDIIETDLVTRSGGLYPSLTGHYRNRPDDQEWRSVSFTDWTL